METFLKIIAPLAVRYRRAIVKFAKRTPYFHLKSPDGSTYMNRYWIVKPSRWTRGWGIRVHEILASDQDRVLHDHPWKFYSIILDGGYFEVMAVCDTEQDAIHERYVATILEPYGGWEVRFEPSTGKWTMGRDMLAGDVNANTPDTFHRVRLNPDPVDPAVFGEQPATTLFICGPRENSWGFLEDGVKVAWREYETRKYGAAHVAAQDAHLTAAFGPRAHVAAPDTVSANPQPLPRVMKQEWARSAAEGTTNE